ncbi:hypothetical protein VNI00_015883 [Paramarasmius palmivorus]|uniref:Uncharacterized protein n=1 Tax=Paramarasmius palmivorus TaxID=297713 RepID=A0AAW0BJL2_9AGAR
MAFNNVSQVIVAGPAINNVSRDQFNVTARDVYFSSLAEPTEYDEFKRVTTGEMYLLEEIHRDIPGCSCPSCRTQRTIYSVELPERKIKCTAIEYKGPKAQEFWEADFRHFSQNRSPDAWQLYGLNRSNVPFLIFHDAMPYTDQVGAIELVPLGHFYKKSFWGDIFVYWLRLELDCDESALWLNTRGTLTEGPEGPAFRVPGAGRLREITIPSSAEMLQDDIFLQFLLQFPSTTIDRLIVDCALRHYSISSLKSLFREVPLNIPPENTPETLDGLRIDTVYSPSLGAVARWRDGGVLWKMEERKGLVDKTVLDDGLIQ